jgi:hypothetical protein
MDPNRAYLLAKNGIPGEYIVSHPSVARAPPSSSQPQARPKEDTMDRRDSIDSLDSIARKKEEAQTQPSRSGMRAFVSKAVGKLSGPVKAQETGGRGGENSKSDYCAHKPFEVYVLGNQVIYLPSSNRHLQRE